MKATNIRIVATALFLSVCGIAAGTSLLTTPAAARDNGGGGGGGGVGASGSGMTGGIDSANVFAVDQFYARQRQANTAPPTAQPRLIPLEQPNLHQCEGRIRLLRKENGRRIIGCDIYR